MPIKIDGYQCSKCLYVHKDFELAKNCEKRHGTDFEYSLYFDHGKVGPSSITCTFIKQDGEKTERTFY